MRNIHSHKKAKKERWLATDGEREGENGVRLEGKKWQKIKDGVMEEGGEREIKVSAGPALLPSISSVLLQRGREAVTGLAIKPLLTVLQHPHTCTHTHTLTVQQQLRQA